MLPDIFMVQIYNKILITNKFLCRIFPDEKSRVILTGDEQVDYINANYIDITVGAETYHYIATQVFANLCNEQNSTISSKTPDQNHVIFVCLLKGTVAQNKQRLLADDLGAEMSGCCNGNTGYGEWESKVPSVLARVA